MTQVSSLYLHVPFCRHLCNYCDFYKKRFENPTHQIGEFHGFLLNSLNRHRELMAQYQVTMAPLETVYLGGGTPSLWGAEGAEFFRTMNLDVRPDAEFTMEIDPGTWNHGMITHWKKQGMNRISIGTQTLDPQFLKIMDRDHGLEDSFQLLQYCGENGWNFSLDFLLGLPYSKEKNRNIARELETFLSFNPKHVSLYILNARSKYPHVSAMPDDEFIRDEYLLVCDVLKAHGFHHYEVSNFAIPGFESKHNKKYWKTESVAALGPTGTGLFVLGEDQAVRYKWKVTSADVEIENLGPQELKLERGYMALRTSEGWKPENPKPELIALFDKWKIQDYGSWDGEKIRLKSTGFLILDSLMDDLFRLSAL